MRCARGAPSGSSAHGSSSCCQTGPGSRRARRSSASTSTPTRSGSRASCGRVRAHLEAFLTHVGAPFPLPHPLPPDLRQGAEAFFSERRPDEAVIPLEPLPYPVLVVTGAHEPAFDAVADVLCSRLGAERLVLAGAGHAVQRAPGFNPALAAFVDRAEPR